MWNTSGIPKSTETLSEVLKVQVDHTPYPKRCNSLYDSLNQLNTQREKLGDIGVKLNQPSIKDAKLNYLEEYTKILKPLLVSFRFSLSRADRIDYVITDSGLIICTLSSRTLLIKHHLKITLCIGNNNVLYFK